jgi:DNA-binding transcriptional LysR family regulator
MELRHLRYFLAVANERNFTRAADGLGVAQPPLSRQIRQLELELGVELIDRSIRPLKLTEAGWLLYEQANQVLAGVEQLKTLLRRHVATDRRRFVIGCVGSTLYGVVPAMIVRFRRNALNIDVDLVDMPTFEQIKALKEGRVDVGIGRLRFEEEGIRRQVIREEPLVAALPFGHPLSEGQEPIGLDALAKETLIIYPRPMRPSYADQVLSAFHDQGLSPAVVREVSDLQTALGLVAAQAGLCIVPTSVQRLRQDDVSYRQLAGSPLTSPIIVSSRDSDASAEVELFRAIGAEMRAQDSRHGLP